MNLLKKIHNNHTLSDISEHPKKIKLILLSFEMTFHSSRKNTVDLVLLVMFLGCLVMIPLFNDYAVIIAILIGGWLAVNLLHEYIRSYIFIEETCIALKMTTDEVQDHSVKEKIPTQFPWELNNDDYDHEDD